MSIFMGDHMAYAMAAAVGAANVRREIEGNDLSPPTPCPADHEAGAGLPEMGSADRRPDSGGAGRGKAVAAGPGRDRAKATKFEHLTDDQLASAIRQTKKVMSVLNGQVVRLQRERDRRAKRG